MIAVLALVLAVSLAVLVWAGPTAIRQHRQWRSLKAWRDTEDQFRRLTVVTGYATETVEALTRIANAASVTTKDIDRLGASIGETH